MEVSVPSDFAPQPTNRCLRTSLDEQPQSCLDGSSLCPRSVTPHCLAHQAVVNIDVGAHLFHSPMCNIITFVCMVQSSFFFSLGSFRGFFAAVRILK
jgi:hypothetical protein